MHLPPLRFLAVGFLLSLSLSACGERAPQGGSGSPVPPPVPPQASAPVPSTEPASQVEAQAPAPVPPPATVAPDEPVAQIKTAPSEPAAQPKPAPQESEVQAGSFTLEEIQSNLSPPPQAGSVGSEAPPPAAPAPPAVSPADTPAQPRRAPEADGLPVAKFATLNALVLEVIMRMPHGGGYAVTGQAAANLVSSTALDPATGALKIESKKAQPSYCSGATYLAFLEVISELQTKYQLQLPPGASQALLVQRQPDGVGIWGRWNSNGPGTAKLLHDLGIGVNFTDFAEAKPGDFMKIWWNDGIGSTERGHSVVYLDSFRGTDGTEMVKFWSSNQDTGFSEKTIPKEKIVRVLFSRFEDPTGLAKAASLPKKDEYLAAMLKRPSTEEEMFEVCGVDAPPGSSLLRNPSRPRQASGEATPPPTPAAETSESSPLIPPAPAEPKAMPRQEPEPAALPAVETPAAPPVPDLNQMFAGTAYERYNFLSRTTILRKAQEKLATAKDYPGQPDGAPGPMTDGAIKAWQKKHQLPATGILDKATLHSLHLENQPELKESAPPKPPAGTVSGAPPEAQALPRPNP